jgi:hypothetical protein
MKTTNIVSLRRWRALNSNLLWAWLERGSRSRFSCLVSLAGAELSWLSFDLFFLECDLRLRLDNIALFTQNNLYFLLCNTIINESKYLLILVTEISESYI